MYANQHSIYPFPSTMRQHHRSKEQSLKLPCPAQAAFEPHKALEQKTPTTEYLITVSRTTMGKLHEALSRYLDARGYDRGSMFLARSLNYEMQKRIIDLIWSGHWNNNLESGLAEVCGGYFPWFKSYAEHIVAYRRTVGARTQMPGSSLYVEVDQRRQAFCHDMMSCTGAILLACV